MGLTLAAATLCIASIVACPQTPTDAQARTSIMSASEIRGLNKKLREWMGAELEYLADPTPRVGKKRAKARDKFKSDWRSREKKHGELLGSVPDLEAVFRNAFPYEAPRGMKGAVSAQNTRGDGPKYDAFLPKSYDPDEATRVVLLLPAVGPEGKFVDGRTQFEQTWGGTKLLDDTIFIMPSISEDLDIDARPDFGQPNAEATDVARRAAVLGVAGDAQRNLHFDRDRFVLDCAKGSSVFGLRIATYYPARFAGLILRDPQDAGLRYESLVGLPILLIQTPESKAFCEQLAELMKKYDSPVEIVEAEDEHPYPAAKERIAEWVAGIERNLFRDRVLIAPNHDLYRKGYWIQIGTAEPLASVSREDRPFLDARVVRDENKIVVDTKSIENFVMLLNDDIVDLDKEITLVVNGVAEKRLRGRSFSLLQSQVLKRFDPGSIFTAEWPVTVPKQEK